MRRAAVRLAAGLLAMLASAAMAQQHSRRAFPGDGGAAGGGGADAVLATASEWGGASGVYTCEQWRQYLERMFRLGDKRRRGFIDAQDFAVIPRASTVFRAATFDYFDVAGKGRVTRQEFVSSPSPFFARYDKKKACRVTQEDIRQPKPSAPGEPASHSGAPRGGGRGQGRFGAGF